VAGVYRSRHPERTVLYRVLFHYFDQFLADYESRFEKEYGFLRPIIKEVVERYLDCGNPRCGFARIRCPSCGEERLVMFSCRSRGFCPSCHSKRRETLLLDVPHRQVVFTIPKMLRIFFRYKRRLLGDLCQAAIHALLKYLQAITGIYANAHRGKVRKGQPDKHPFIIVEEESTRVPRRGWAEMIRKVFEVDPLVCPQCRSRMRIIAFITDYAVVDRIIAHLKLTFVAERPPPPHLVYQELLMDSETGTEYFS
jgi:hypothetical protein